MVGLLVSILVVVVGVSVAMGAGASGSSSSAHASRPSVQANPIAVVVEECMGNAEFDIYGAGWRADDIVLLSLNTGAGRLYVGAGFPGESMAFVDGVTAPVTGCGVMTIEATGGSTTITAPVSIVASK